MSPDLRDFGIPDYFEPETIGVPGNRRFRIVAGSAGRTASLWIEREQLQALVVSLQQVLAQVTDEDVLRPELENPGPPPTPRSDFPDLPDIEFQVGPIALGYDEDSGMIVILVSPAEIIEVEGTPTLNDAAESQFRALLSSEAIERFADMTERVIAAGRPRCPFCGQALKYADEPHGCIKQNGHRTIETG